jgi:hypothetical protein
MGNEGKGSDVRQRCRINRFGTVPRDKNNFFGFLKIKVHTLQDVPNAEQYFQRNIKLFFFLYALKKSLILPYQTYLRLLFYKSPSKIMDY